MGVAKVIAFTCSALTVVLMIAATSTSDWMMTGGWREGLFSQCIGSKGWTPVPFEESRDYQFLPGCYKGRGIGYLLGVTALVIIELKADFLATVFLGIDVFKNTKKYKKLSVIGLSTAGVALLLAVIIYGVYFSKDLHDEPSLDGRIWDINAPDYDWDNDGILDDEDADDDNDGIFDDVDPDDDNDGILDIENSDDEDVLGDPDGNDLDNDGIPDDEDPDDDNDGIPDDEDPDDDNDGIPDDVDLDDNNDGILDIEDSDDDNWQNDDVDAKKKRAPLQDYEDYEGYDEEGEEYVEEQEGPRRVFSYGFGFGATCFSIVLIFISVGLIILDRESKQVDGHENQIEQDQEEQGGNA